MTLSKFGVLLPRNSMRVLSHSLTAHQVSSNSTNTEEDKDLVMTKTFLKILVTINFAEELVPTGN